jgi:GNAT superfamily N-acetyltransferase|tara:strand:+ start:846 stop:1307 length:462 start_codon:yes stop_codon:yes gene_type:complete
MSDYILRDAIETDVLDIVLAVKQFCKEVPHPAWGRFDSNKVKDLVSSLIDSEAGFVKIVTIDEEVVGALIATATPVPINSFIFAQELMFWLDPDHRNGKTSPKLIDAYVEWSKAVGCDFVRLSTLDELLDSRVGVIFKRKGFKPIETAYIKEL